jgi:hypothetical protein
MRCCRDALFPYGRQRWGVWSPRLLHRVMRTWIVFSTQTRRRHARFMNTASMIATFPSPPVTSQVQPDFIAHRVFGTPANQKSEAIAMTAPVITNSPDSTTIAMTAPVLSTSNVMSFILPSSIQNVAEAPVPSNPQVNLRQLPQRDLACAHARSPLQPLTASQLILPGPLLFGATAMKTLQVRTQRRCSLPSKVPTLCLPPLPSPPTSLRDTTRLSHCGG